jgi:hypothetical protein
VLASRSKIARGIVLNNVISATNTGVSHAGADAGPDAGLASSYSVVTIAIA